MKILREGTFVFELYRSCPLYVLQFKGDLCDPGCGAQFLAVFRALCLILQAPLLIVTCPQVVNIAVYNQFTDFGIASNSILFILYSRSSGEQYHWWG